MSYTREQAKRWDRWGVDEITKRLRIRRKTDHTPEEPEGWANMSPEDRAAWNNAQQTAEYWFNLDTKAMRDYLILRQKTELPTRESKSEMTKVDNTRKKLKIGRSGQSIPTFSGGVRTGDGANV